MTPSTVLVNPEAAVIGLDADPEENDGFEESCVALGDAYEIKAVLVVRGTSVVVAAAVEEQVTLVVIVQSEGTIPCAELVLFTLSKKPVLLGAVQETHCPPLQVKL